MLLIDSLSFSSKKQYNLLTTFTVSQRSNFFLLNFLQMLLDFKKNQNMAVDPPIGTVSLNFVFILDSVLIR